MYNFVINGLKIHISETMYLRKLRFNIIIIIYNLVFYRQVNNFFFKHLKKLQKISSDLSKEKESDKMLAPT